MLQVRLQSYLIQLSLQGGHLSGAGKSHVQARRDGVDEVNVMLFGCSYQSRQLFWVWKEKSQLFLLVKYVVQSWFKLEPPFEPAGTSWDQQGVCGLCWGSPASPAVYRSLQYILCLESSLGAYR